MKDSPIIGQASESSVLAALLTRKIPVLLPFGNAQRYDLVFDLNGKLFRVQCKTGRVRNGVIRFNPCDNNRRSYVGQVEFLAVFEPDLEKVYLIEPSMVGRQFASLRLIAPKNGQKTKIQYADDFLLDKVLGSIGG